MYVQIVKDRTVTTASQSDKIKLNHMLANKYSNQIM